MKRKIVVENGLDDVRQYLAGVGYDVRTMYLNDTANHITTDEYDAIIVNDRGSLDMENLKTSSPVIEAAGLSPERVHQRIKDTGMH